MRCAVEDTRIGDRTFNPGTLLGHVAIIRDCSMSKNGSRNCGSIEEAA